MNNQVNDTGSDEHIVIFLFREQADTGSCMSNPRPSVGRGRARGRIRQNGSPGISPVGLRNTDVTQSDVPRVVPKAADYIPPRPGSVTEESRLKRNQR